MDTVVMDVVRVGLTACVFIVGMKLLTQLVPIPGVTQFFAAV